MAVEVDETYDPLDISRSATGFNYSGIDSLGAEIDGFVQTTDVELARNELQRAGIRVTSITPRRVVRQKVKKPTLIDFASLAEQFGDLMEIGEPPTAVCRMLAQTQTNKYLAEALINASELIRNGWSISDAFAAQRDKDGESLFPVTFICALRIGEEVGSSTDEDTGESKSAFLLTLKRFAESDITVPISKKTIFPRSAACRKASAPYGCHCTVSRIDRRTYSPCTRWVTSSRVRTASWRASRSAKRENARSKSATAGEKRSAVRAPKNLRVS